jgi:hypothetical protein
MIPKYTMDLRMMDWNSFCADLFSAYGNQAHEALGDDIIYYV